MEDLYRAGRVRRRRRLEHARDRYRARLLYVGTGNAYDAPAASTTDAVLAMEASDRNSLALVWKANVGPGGDLGGILGSTAWDGGAVQGVNCAVVVPLGL
jgi:hypothetical protein